MRLLCFTRPGCLRGKLGCVSLGGVSYTPSRGLVYRTECSAERPSGFPTASHWLAERSRPHEEKLALIDGNSGKDVTFGDLFRRAFGFAHGLRERGFRQGDVYMMLSPNTIDFVVAGLGVIASGGTFSCLNPAYKKGEIQRAMDLVKPTFFHTLPPLAKELGDIREMSSHLLGMITSEGLSEGGTAFEDLISSDNKPTTLGDDFDPKTHTALLLFSSGTTGVPKGVQLSSDNIICSLCTQCEPGNWNITSEDRLFGIFPYFHCGGLVASLFGFLAIGSSVICVPAFEMEQYLSIIEKYKPSVINIPPTLGRTLVSHPATSKYDLSSVTQIIAGAAPVRENLITQLHDLFKNAIVQSLYGMTETTCVTHNTMLSNAPVGSVGPVCAGIDCKIAALEDGRELDQGEEGEVCIRGDVTMLGYYDNPRATAECFDGEGYYRTGDIGYCDKDGNLFIVDRLKELIKCKGFQVAPAELEDLLLHHQAVADVGVIGIPYQDDELVRAYIVRKPGSDVTEEDLKTYVAENTTYYKHLRGGVRFINDIPKLPSGKILRRELKDLAKAENS